LWAWAWAQREGGSLRRGGSDDSAGVGAGGPRAGVMAGRQGQAVQIGAGAGGGPLATGAVRIRGSGRSPP
jgi:hypothetical protein